MHKKTVYIISLVLSAAIFCSPTLIAQKPGWVEKRPAGRDYYVGIGISEKTASAGKEYIQIAKDNALSDLATEITVTISSDFYHKIIESSGETGQSIKSEIHASTEELLEGYELAGTWENENEYWVFYRLSKEYHRMQKQEKLDKAMSLSLDLYRTGNLEENSNNIENALMFYLQAFQPIEKYIAEPLETTYNGANIYLMNEIYSSAQNLISNIQISAVEGRRKATVGKPLNSPLQFKAVYKKNDSTTIDIPNLPLEFSFVRGSGNFVKKSRTNRSGIANCPVYKITSMEKLQIVKTDIDVLSMLNTDKASVILSGIVNSLSAPSARIILEVAGLSVFITSTENHLGNPLPIPVVEPKIKNEMQDKGFTFTDKIEDAEIAIEIHAESKKGPKFREFYTTFVDCSITVIDLSTGVELYKVSYIDVKGTHSNYDSAGYKAYRNIADSIGSEAIPELIEQIQK